MPSRWLSSRSPEGGLPPSLLHPSAHGPGKAFPGDMTQATLAGSCAPPHTLSQPQQPPLLCGALTAFGEAGPPKPRPRCLCSCLLTPCETLRGTGRGPRGAPRLQGEQEGRVSNLCVEQLLCRKVWAAGGLFLTGK